jgi:sec-independent protein translocase protein TatA
VILNDILQPTHLLLILVVALLVLGPKRLPEATRSIGRGIHDFKSAVTGDSKPGDRVTADVAAREPGGGTV